MKTTDLLRRRRLRMALFMTGVLGAGGAVIPAESDGQSAPRADAGRASPPARAAEPVPPSTAETAESAFKRLAAGKRYVTREDARLLDGFDQVFEAADADHDGRLSLEEFGKAWVAYKARDKSNRG